MSRQALLDYFRERAPLIAGPEQFEEIEAVLRPVLEEASRRMGSH